MAHDDSEWEQPGFGNNLDAIAVELISAEVQRIFGELDPVKLVEEAGLDLTAEDKATVAHLIDTAVVEMEIDFSGEVEHEHEHEH